MQLVELEHEFPPVERLGVAIGGLGLALERRFPGILREWSEILASDTAKAEVIKLRHPRETAAVIESFQEALVLARHIEITANARLGSKRSRKKHAA